MEENKYLSTNLDSKGRKYKTYTDPKVEEKITVSGPTGIFEIEGKHIGIIDGEKMTIEEYYKRMGRRG